MSEYTQPPAPSQPPTRFMLWSSRGFTQSLIPVETGGKKPVHRDWPDTNANEKDCERWDEAGFNVGLLCRDYPCLDIDCDDMKLTKDFVEALRSVLGRPAYPIRYRKDTGRAAVLFKVSASGPQTKQIRIFKSAFGKPEFKLELLAQGQQVVVEGVHPSGTVYRWWPTQPKADDLVELTYDLWIKLRDKLAEVATCHAYVVGQTSSTSKSQPGAQQSRWGVEAPDWVVAVDMLKDLPNTVERDEWVAMAIAMKAAAGGNPQWEYEFELAFDAWSAKHDSYDAAETARVWATAHPDGRTGFGTLYAAAERAGLHKLCLKARSLRHKSQEKKERKSAREDFGEVDDADPVLDSMASSIVAKNVPGWMQRMGLVYSFLLTGGQASVIKQDKRGSVKRFDILGLPAFYADTAKLPPLTDGKRKKHRGRAWLENGARRDYKNVGLYVNRPCPDDTYNIWTGWPLKPDARGALGCTKFLDMLHGRLAAGNDEVYAYILNWCARRVQVPDEPVGSALVFFSETEGTGKGTFANAMMNLFPQDRVMTANNAQQIVGRFNDHLMGQMITFADESFFAGRKGELDRLKSIIVEPYATYEGKGKPVIRMRNTMGLIVATNKPHVIDVETRNQRRFMISEVDDSKAGDRPYWRAVYDELYGQDDGLSCWFDFLLKRDISGFDVETIPRTKTLAQQQAMSMDSVSDWVDTVLDTGNMPGCDPDDWLKNSVQISNDTLYRAFVQHCIDTHKYPEQRETFVRKLHKLTSSANHKIRVAGKGRTTNGTKFNTLAHCRFAFSKHYPHRSDWGTPF